MEEIDEEADLVVDLGRGAAGEGEVSGGGADVARVTPDEDDKFTQGVADELLPNGDGLDTVEASPTADALPTGGALRAGRRVAVGEGCAWVVVVVE